MEDLVDFRLVVRSMETRDWPIVKEFLADELSTAHPLQDETLFFWQFRGFGPYAGVSECQLAIRDDRLCGFRGVIPGLYQFPIPQGGYRLSPGGSGAVWIVARRARGQGVGKALWLNTESRLKVRTSLGARADTAVPFYKSSGFDGVDGLHHWYVALDEMGFLELAYGPWSKIEVATWCESIARTLPVAPHQGDSVEMAQCWTRFADRAKDVFSLHRNAEFWDWRYLTHPYFDYLIFGGIGDPALVVARVERVVTPEHSLLVLRLIEILPLDDLAWAGHTSPVVARLLSGVLSWARENGCVAADFRNVSARLSPTLRSAGFEVNRFEQVDEGGRGLSGLLTPFRSGPKPINAHWKVDRSLGWVPSTPDDVYMVKSDSDMDRPNVPPAELVKR